MSPFLPGSFEDYDPIHLTTWSRNSLGDVFHGLHIGATASVGFGTANRAYFMPFYTNRPFSLARWLWPLGATVGTDYVQAGIYDDAFGIVAASPRVLHAGSANNVQYQTPGIHGTNITSGSDNVDQDTYTTASITLEAGVLYLLAVNNSHASSAPAISSVDSATGGYPTFTSRSSTQYNSNLDRVSIWSCVPTADWTGTLRIKFSASSGVTGAVWAVNGFLHVDTASNDGVVQQAVGTGSSTTPLATLGAYGSANNVGVAAFGAATNNTGAPTSAATKELSDTGVGSPAQSLQTAMATNDTTMDYTITSAAWGACAVEIKSKGTGAITIPAMQGWLALHCTGTTATFMRISNVAAWSLNYIQSSLTAGLPMVATPATAGAGILHIVGFTSRASP